MADASVARKLQLKAGHRVLVLNAPGPAGEVIGALPEGAEFVSVTGVPADAVILFARDGAELGERIGAAAAAAAGDRLLWVAYPKGGSGVKTDINRDTIRARMEETGLETVTQVAIDGTWSALRLRPSQR